MFVALLKAWKLLGNYHNFTMVLKINRLYLWYTLTNWNVYIIRIFFLILINYCWYYGFSWVVSSTYIYFMFLLDTVKSIVFTCDKNSVKLENHYSRQQKNNMKFDKTKLFHILTFNYISNSENLVAFRTWLCYKKEVSHNR